MISTYEYDCTLDIKKNEQWLNTIFPYMSNVVMYVTHVSMQHALADCLLTTAQYW